jgi:iron complex transport system permease protein
LIVIPGSRGRTNPLAGYLVLCVGLVGGVLLALSTGEADIGLSDIALHLGKWITRSGGSPETEYTIVTQVRFPRAMAAMFVGGCLATSGVLYQGLLLNPLAEPYTLGVATGAAFGASLAISFSLRPVALFAFAGGMVTLAVVMALGTERSGTLGQTRLVLAGVVVSSILGAGVTLLKVLAGDRMAAIVFWLLGSFSVSTWNNVLWAALSAACVLGLGIISHRDLDVISSGAAPGSLGVDEKRSRALLLAGSSLATSIAVSISGVIGFVGLVVPHLLRLVFGPAHSRLVPMAFLGGGFLLLLADTAARSMGEMPVGVITALVGGPVFCVLLWRGR